METKRRIIIKRIDGVPVNLKFEPVKSLSAAARFNDIDEYNDFINGYYRPSNADMYKPHKIRITYEEEEDDVQQVGEHNEDIGCSGGV